MSFFARKFLTIRQYGTITFSDPTDFIKFHASKNFRQCVTFCISLWEKRSTAECLLHVVFFLSLPVQINSVCCAATSLSVGSMHNSLDMVRMHLLPKPDFPEVCTLQLILLFRFLKLWSCVDGYLHSSFFQIGGFSYFCWFHSKISAHLVRLCVLQLNVFAVLQRNFHKINSSSVCHNVCNHYYSFLVPIFYLIDYFASNSVLFQTNGVIIFFLVIV